MTTVLKAVNKAVNKVNTKVVKVVKVNTSVKLNGSKSNNNINKSSFKNLSTSNVMQCTSKVLSTTRPKTNKSNKDNNKSVVVNKAVNKAVTQRLSTNYKKTFTSRKL